MFDDEKDDIFLSRWINGELSSEELRDFQSHPEYEHYVKIMAGADALDLTEYDVDTALFEVKNNRQHKTKKNNRPVIKLLPYMAVAASIAIILGIFLFNNSGNTIHTNFGEQMAVTLPDGSEMILNAKSTASFDKKNWDKNRLITLNGEAYFKVKKGSKFTVATENGKVSVLGTEFNVQSYASYFEAICYEGKVSVTTGQHSKILKAGNAYRNIKNTAPESWTFVAQQPSWITNTSSFRSVPIKYVFQELQDQYNITVDTSHIDSEMIYTGTFPNDNIDVALKTVFSTLGIDYSLSQDGKTVVLEK